MMQKLLLTLTLSTLLYGQSLETLLEKVKEQNLLLSQSKERIMIRQEEVELADSWDNPSLSIGANDLLIDDISARDREPMQTHFITLSQKIPTAGKNGLKKSVALVNRDISDTSYHDSVLKVLSQVSGYAYKVAIIDKKLILIAQYQKNVSRVKQLHQKRFEIGKSPQSAIEKSKILAQKLIIKKRKLLTMKRALLYKIEQLCYEKVSSIELSLEMDKHLQMDIEKHPIMIEKNLLVTKSKEQLKLQRARKVPDVKLAFGYFQRQDRSDYLALNASFSLPIRGKEEHEIKIALLKESQAKRALKAKAFTLKREVDILQELMVDSLANYSVIKKEILPKQRYIHALLEKEIFTKNSSTTVLLENLNESIMLELEAYSEMESYFAAYTRLLYFQGDIS